jgi:hypothetical protein
MIIKGWDEIRAAVLCEPKNQNSCGSPSYQWIVIPVCNSFIEKFGHFPVV